MKGIVQKINESGELIKDLENLIDSFNELFDKTNDDDREMLCSELVYRTMRNNKRCKECWDYVFKNYHVQ